MEWQSPAVILSIAPHGEGDLVACVLTEAHGAWRGLARGGASRARAAIWQPGNIADVRWVARLADSLGSFSAELAQPIAAQAMQDGWRLSVLTAALANCAAALPDREAHPAILAALLRVLAHLPLNRDAIAELVRFEVVLLRELGFGLDLSRCAVNPQANDLTYVSPRTGRALSQAVGAPYHDRLLPLPLFLQDPEAAPDLVSLGQGLRLTGHFLTKNLFGSQNKPLPAARQALADLLARELGGT